MSADPDTSRPHDVDRAQYGLAGVLGLVGAYTIYRGSQAEVEAGHVCPSVFFVCTLVDTIPP